MNVAVIRAILCVRDIYTIPLIFDLHQNRVSSPNSALSPHPQRPQTPSVKTPDELKNMVSACSYTFVGMAWAQMVFGVGNGMDWLTGLWM